MFPCIFYLLAEDHGLGVHVHSLASLGIDDILVVFWFDVGFRLVDPLLHLDNVLLDSAVGVLLQEIFSTVGKFCQRECFLE
jgi:hypothetical protein